MTWQRKDKNRRWEAGGPELLTNVHMGPQVEPECSHQEGRAEDVSGSCPEWLLIRGLFPKPGRRGSACDRRGEG